MFSRGTRESNAALRPFMNSLEPIVDHDGQIPARIARTRRIRSSMTARIIVRMLLPRRRCCQPTLELVQPTIDFHDPDQVTNELVHVKATLRHAGVAQALGDVLKRWAHDGLLPLLPDLLMHTTKRWPLVAVAT